MPPKIIEPALPGQANIALDERGPLNIMLDLVLPQLLFLTPRLRSIELQAVFKLIRDGFFLRLAII